MKAERSDAVLGEMEDLLDQERRMLMKGDLDTLERLLTRKESVLRRMADLDAPAHDRVRALREKLARNQDLMESAMSGIRSVAERLASLRRVREGLNTYDCDGRAHTLEGAAHRQVEKRA